ncbi:uncharacterized protein LOC112350899 [Selaginella moellendorffii]|uniref:uncharacterized protein LOC112350899 n=1 Tax=Selaginella moellendorffii TaxID=88036 RepID=UPI000D1CCF60|nr:uncharacterized protein LOC112350899 [Selaginella moellendorffii]|eukprot:XP_024543689.1 uncharacterized protein LOC112350899 [Selaginella moellendorffii]
MVTFRVSEKEPAVVPRSRPQHGHFLEGFKDFQEEGCYQVLQGTSVDASAFHPVKNGFVTSVIRAYSCHHNLVIRPDDVWLAIAVQFGFFVDGNAEALRSIFVDHEGKKELVVSQVAALHSADYGLLAREMSVELKKNVKDEKVCDWILPSFSTTTKNDVIAGSVVLMATFKSYFEYRFRLACGIPFVTLLGTTEDWEEIDLRVDELDKYGENCKKWRVMLKKITAQFVDSSKGNVDTEFWNKICHHYGGGSGPSYTSGWISAFCVFDKKGEWQGDVPEVHPVRRLGRDNTAKMEYPCILSGSIPSGYLTVDVKVDDNGKTYEAFMFAGHMGFEIVQNDDKGIAPKVVWAITLKNKLKKAKAGSSG